MQRFFDILFSGIAIILLSPVFLILILILRFSGEGEIIFSQPRVGRFGKKIFILKFVTMLKNSPNMGSGTVTLKNDPRVLPVGKFLRKTKLNELPQLINIFIGDMSLIGPRPQTIRCFEAFPQIYQKEIMKVRPGLSGIGSIVFRNEEEILSNSKDADYIYDELIMPYKGELESWYIKRKNIFLYFYLIFLTTLVVFFDSIKIKTFLPKSIPSMPDLLKKCL